MGLPNVECTAIIGVGLIGGSFGMALKKRGLARKVVGVGRNPDRLRRAVELCAIDAWTTDLDAVASEANLIYIATPVGMVLDFVRRAAPLAPSGCIITDAGSTKAEICQGASHLIPSGISFIGGHPMAGSDVTGVEAGSPDLFVNAAYVLTPLENADPHALELLRDLAEAIGARVIIMSPQAHDRCVAVISHLPHLMAAALVHLTSEQADVDPRIVELIAGSFRDMTRVAGSSPELWRDICISNSDSITRAVEDLRAKMEDAVRLMESGNRTDIEHWFKQARDFRQSLFDKRSGE
ncbi:MAG: prephenate dehydrogenase/arogenate dehydrogenase family protein [Armatimonadetes bacterium]|nr:prephenate dehydrogenase/arogenate dehydrogenase family protein [Armatimonadota bacterium]